MRGSRLAGNGSGLPRLQRHPRLKRRQDSPAIPRRRASAGLFALVSLLLRSRPAEAILRMRPQPVLPTTLPGRSAPGSTPQRERTSTSLGPARRAATLPPRRAFPAPLCGPPCETTPQKSLLLSSVVEINFQMRSTTQGLCSASRGRTSQRRTTDAQCRRQAPSLRPHLPDDGCCGSAPAPGQFLRHSGPSAGPQRSPVPAEPPSTSIVRPARQASFQSLMRTSTLAAPLYMSMPGL